MQAASLVSISGFASVPATVSMGLISDRFGRKKAALICASLMVVSMLWLTESSNLGMLYVFAIAFGLAYGGLAPPTTAVAGDVFGTCQIGLVFGLLQVGWLCGAAVGPALAGYIFDVSGKYHVAFLIGIAAALMIVVLVLFLKTPAVRAKK